jgi:lipid-A-disaccharide synthase-like uncharacterized protein
MVGKMLKVDFWLVFGLVGQLFFSARFIVQWVQSELKRRSVVPISFWFLSLGGSITLLIYAIHRRDPVFILGQSAGLLIYVRNLALIRKNRLAESNPVGP